MAEFVANRLSSGNRILPDRVNINGTGVSLRIPGLFSKEKTLVYHQISSIDVTNPLVGFSTVTFITRNGEWIKCQGFSKADADEIKRIVQLGINGNVVNSAVSQNIIMSNPEELAKAEAQKALAEVEQHKLELEEQKNREERADKLRSQGKDKQAFVVEHWKIITSVGGVLALGLFYLIFFLVAPDKKGNEKLDAELTRKDEQIQMLIHDGKKEEALNSINELQDDSHEQSDHKNGMFSSYTYFEYWSMRRDELRKEALGNDDKNNKTQTTNQSTTQPVSNTASPVADTTKQIAEQAKADTTSKQASNAEEMHSGVVIADKTFFYEEAKPETRRKGFLIKGQAVTYTKTDGDFIYCSYVSEKGITSGWILKSDVQ